MPRQMLQKATADPQGYGLVGIPHLIHQESVAVRRTTQGLESSAGSLRNY